MSSLIDILKNVFQLWMASGLLINTHCSNFTENIKARGVLPTLYTWTKVSEKGYTLLQWNSAIMTSLKTVEWS